MGQYFAVSAPGLESITRGELIRLGLLTGSAPSREEVGGVTFEGGREVLYRANLCLATASRVLVRLGDFYAVSFPELVKKARRLPWEDYILSALPVAVHATCHKSRLYHSGAVAERIFTAIADKLGKPISRAKTVDSGKGGSTKEAGDEPDPPQMVIVRLSNDHVTISVDSSGALLHRRGYRLETAKAPLRETLAAAMILASGWEKTAPLLDPFCGSGTIPIEAARMALGIPPGYGRDFAFMRWPGFRPDQWAAVRACHAPDPKASVAVMIQASDRDAGGIRIAQSNAERAGVISAIDFTHRAVSAITPPSIPGWVITNPPYGIRVSANNDLRNLYAQLGNVLRAKCLGWNATILCSDLRLLGQTGLHLDTSFSMVNGGLRVILGRAKIS